MHNNYFDIPRICRYCDKTECKKDPYECETEAKEAEADRKYHLMREGDD